MQILIENLVDKETYIDRNIALARCRVLNGVGKKNIGEYKYFVINDRKNKTFIVKKKIIELKEIKKVKDGIVIKKERQRRSKKVLSNTIEYIECVKKVVELRKKGYTLEQCSEILNISEATLQNRYNKWRKKGIEGVEKYDPKIHSLKDIIVKIDKNKFEELKTNRRLSFSKLARMSNLSLSILKSFKEDKNIKLSTIQKIATALNVPVANLIKNYEM